MLINGSSANNTVTVASGGTLGGIGKLGDVTIQGGGTLSTTNNYGPFFVNSLTLASNAAIKLSVSGTNTTQFDSITAAGAIALGGSLYINMSGSYNSTNKPGLFQIFTTGAGITGNFSSVTLAGSYVGSMDYYSNNNTWQIWSALGPAPYYANLNLNTGVLTVVPEPSTCVLVGLGALAFLIRFSSRKDSLG